MFISRCRIAALRCFINASYQVLDVQVSVPLEHLYRLVPETNRILTAKNMIMNGNQSESYCVY
jgi:hypothetical protein